MDTKTCTRCSETKLITLFAKCRDKYRARCKSCHSQDTIEWQKNNPEKYLAKNKAWRAINKQPRVFGPPMPEDIAKKRIKLSSEKWKKNNPEKHKLCQKNYAIRTKSQCMEKVRYRQAKKLNATPKWANRFFMKEAYHLSELRSKMLGFKWEVDHIVPLQSKLVCGLHVEHNLQVIPHKENRSKGNRYWPYMP